VTVDLSTAHGIAELGRDEMRARVAALAPDVVFANEAEATAFGGPMGGAWVVKRGARGCSVLRGGELVEYAGVEVERVIDTTGAGDAFAAGYLLERDLPSAVYRAQAAAARCIARPGALP
jgi:sugar/nucleoside kinase (ribokinase family)